LILVNQHLVRLPHNMIAHFIKIIQEYLIHMYKQKTIIIISKYLSIQLKKSQINKFN